MIYVIIKQYIRLIKVIEDDEYMTYLDMQGKHEWNVDVEEPIRF
jgi:hypothetical protein